MRTLRRLSLLLLTSIAPLCHGGNFRVIPDQSTLSASMHASPSHDFTSVAKDYVCDIDINPQDMTLIKASCRFKFADLDSGKSSRDSKMCHWMDIEHYPSAEFTMTEVHPGEDAQTQIAEGIFTMHGVSRPIQITFTLKEENGQVRIDGQTTLNHENWDLKKVRLLFFSVDPVLKPEFHLVGTLNPDA